MSTLSVLFNEACTKANSYAAIYPKNPPAPQDVVPGVYGTFQDGIWAKKGTFADFGVQVTLPDPTDYEGPGTWSSDKMATTAMTFNGTTWVVGDDGAGDGTAGLQFSDSTNTLFHVATAGLFVQEIDEGILDQIAGKVKTLNGYNQLRFVIKTLFAQSYVSFGGVSKGASCLVSGTANALSDFAAGRVTGAVSIVQTNVSEINQTLIGPATLVPIGMVMYEISEHHGTSVNNDAQ